MELWKHLHGSVEQKARSGLNNVQYMLFQENNRPRLTMDNRSRVSHELPRQILVADRRPAKH